MLKFHEISPFFFSFLGIKKTSVEKGSKPHWSKREFGIFILKRGKNENVLLVVSL
ncbi:hypothetical protein LMIV_2790 [Listeria monocytogenes FSL J1-208]|nr:hypothetical protein LMIV_2790 [Listeria monocytogenes FSL J1-208]